jgi:endo-1,4-beta-xylanase
MVSFRSVLSAIATFAVIGVSALPGNITARTGTPTIRAGTPSSTGTSNGYYYSFW